MRNKRTIILYFLSKRPKTMQAHNKSTLCKYAPVDNVLTKTNPLKTKKITNKLLLKDKNAKQTPSKIIGE
ncbi:hypothetical protein VCHA38O209_80182 [Vibrio chagasii]|nr:hypothetical protein VCHA38O209_80182 [Vibrio chagasii]